ITLPATKQSFMARTAAEIPSVVDRAFRAAISGRPGPVLVDLPKSVLMERAEAVFPGENCERVPARVSEWREEDVARAAEMILASRQAVLYVGGGAMASNASAEVRELAELTQIPVTTTIMALGAFPSRDPLSLGMLGMHGCYATNTAICHADLLIAIGARFDDRVTGRIKDFASRAKKIHVDIDPSEINKNVRVDLALVGDAGGTLRALIKELKRRILAGEKAAHAGRMAWLERIEAWRGEHPLEFDRYSRAVKPQYVIETL